MILPQAFLRIGCWNVNSLRVRWPLVESWLKKEKIDIALLQETKVTDDLFPKGKIEELGYYSAFWGEKSYNGTAILSRWPLLDTLRCDLNGTGAARYIQAITHNIRLCSVYVPQGQDFAQLAFTQKLRFMDGLFDHTKHYVHDLIPTIIGGDYNIALHDEDVWDPVVWHNRVMCSAPERQSLRKMLWAGWITAHQRIKGQPNAPTWWSYQQGAWPKKHGLCIDFFLLSPSAADCFSNTWVSTHWRGMEQASDHAPIGLEIQLPERA